MTAPQASVSRATRLGAAPPPLAATAWLFAAGGGLWSLAAVVGGEDGTTRFQIAEVIWLLSHLALFVGTIRLWRSGLHNARRTATAGFGLAALGRVVFAVAEVAALAVGETQDVLLPVAALLTSIGMLVVGASILRAGRWAGASRFAPLATGIYPFLAMFPLAATGAEGPPPASLAGWGIVTVTIGLGLFGQVRSGTAGKEAS